MRIKKKGEGLHSSAVRILTWEYGNLLSISTQNDFCLFHTVEQQCWDAEQRCCCLKYPVPFFRVQRMQAFTWRRELTETAGILLVGISCRPPSLLANTLPHPISVQPSCSTDTARIHSYVWKWHSLEKHYFIYLNIQTAR